VGEVGQIAERSWAGGPNLVEWLPATRAKITEETEEDEEQVPQKPYFEEFAEKNIGKVSHGISLSRVAYDSIQNEWVPNHPQFGALVAEKKKMPTPVVQPKPE